jgi:anti-sigma factor RsiW
VTTSIWQRIRGGGQPGLTCVELVELVTDYLEGALSPAEHARVERHLDACENCTHYVEEMRTTIALVGRIEEDDLSEEAKSELLEAFRGWARG